MARIAKPIRIPNTGKLLVGTGATTPRAIASGFALALVGCAGCAHLPDATIRYYLAQSAVSFKAVRTVACAADGRLVSATTVTPSVAHAADRSSAHAIPLASLRGAFTDGDLKVELYDDGRLKSVNATGTGEAQPILKTAIAIVGAAVATQSIDGHGKPATPCERVKAAGRGKPRTLTYEGAIDLSRGPAVAQPLEPDPAARELLDAVGGACAYVLDARAMPPPFEYAAQDGDVVIVVRPPGEAHVVVRTGGLGGGCDAEPPAWDGRVTAAQLGKGHEYALPIPKPPLFGKQVFAATFQESGALSSVQYASTAGTGSALDALGAAVSGATGAAAAKAAQLKAESDLIEQQERFVRCEADPASCK